MQIINLLMLIWEQKADLAMEGFLWMCIIQGTICWSIKFATTKTVTDENNLLSSPTKHSRYTLT